MWCGCLIANCQNNSSMASSLKGKDRSEGKKAVQWQLESLSQRFWRLQHYIGIYCYKPHYLACKNYKRCTWCRSQTIGHGRKEAWCIPGSEHRCPKFNVGKFFKPGSVSAATYEHTDRPVLQTKLTEKVKRAVSAPVWSFPSQLGGFSGWWGHTRWVTRWVTHSARRMQVWTPVWYQQIINNTTSCSWSSIIYNYWFRSEFAYSRCGRTLDL